MACRRKTLGQCVSHPMKIYKDDDTPVDDWKELNRITEEERTEKKVVKKQKRCSRKKGKKAKPAASENKPLYLPKAEVSAASIDLYGDVYGDDDISIMPPLITFNCPDPSFYDSDNEHVSDYDLDTEDEDWISVNKKLTITPCYLEDVFKQLNEAVKKKLIKLDELDKVSMEKLRDYLKPESVGDDVDLQQVLSYWKKKTIKKKNIIMGLIPASTLQKTRKGYVNVHPYSKFVEKDRKVAPPRELIKTQQQKASKKLLMEERLQKLTELRSHLQDISLRITGIQNNGVGRDQIKSKLHAFEQRYQEEVKNEVEIIHEEINVEIVHEMIQL